MNENKTRNLADSLAEELELEPNWDIWRFDGLKHWGRFDLRWEERDGTLTPIATCAGKEFVGRKIEPHFDNYDFLSCSICRRSGLHYPDMLDSMFDREEFESQNHGCMRAYCDYCQTWNLVRKC